MFVLILMELGEMKNVCLGIKKSLNNGKDLVHTSLLRRRMCIKTPISVSENELMFQ